MTVESPCISACELDERNVCKGCFRTLEEIGHWSLANDVQRQEYLRLSSARKSGKSDG